MKDRQDNTKDYHDTVNFYGVDLIAIYLKGVPHFRMVDIKKALGFKKGRDINRFIHKKGLKSISAYSGWKSYIGGGNNTKIASALSLKYSVLRENKGRVKDFRTFVACLVQEQEKKAVISQEAAECASAPVESEQDKAQEPCPSMDDVMENMQESKITPISLPVPPLPPLPPRRKSKEAPMPEKYLEVTSSPEEINEMFDEARADDKAELEKPPATKTTTLVAKEHVLEMARTIVNQEEYILALCDDGSVASDSLVLENVRLKSELDNALESLKYASTYAKMHHSVKKHKVEAKDYRNVTDIATALNVELTNRDASDKSKFTGAKVTSLLIRLGYMSKLEVAETASSSIYGEPVTFVRHYLIPDPVVKACEPFPGSNSAPFCKYLTIINEGVKVSYQWHKTIVPFLADRIMSEDKDGDTLFSD